MLASVADPKAVIPPRAGPYQAKVESALAMHEIM